MANKYFFGNEVSEYGVKYGKVDYKAFASAFNHVSMNEIIELMYTDKFYFDLENGCDVDECGASIDIFQYYIVDDFGAELIKNYTDEILYYCSDLDMYVWGVTHFGTGWDYVLTDIDCQKGIIEHETQLTIIY